MSKFGGGFARNKEWSSMFDPATGVDTGMECDEAFEIVLSLARDVVKEDADTTHEYSEYAEAFGILERVRNFMNKKQEEIDNG